jgi:hypothetical protein
MGAVGEGRAAWDGRAFVLPRPVYSDLTSPAGIIVKVEDYKP